MALKSNVLLIAVIAATGGLLFGFDTGVISGALPFLKDYWKLSDASMEWITTTVLIGAVIGAITSGKLSDYLGRKKMIIINAIIFAVGALGCAFAWSIEVLIVMRILIGIAIGITSYLVPMYIAEISPSRSRGLLVTLNQLMITIGILVSYITDYQLSNDADLESWRWMSLVGFFPTLVLLIGIATTFWFYSFVCLGGLIWGYFYIPETKGKSLEDIEKHWRKGGSPRSL